MTTLRLLTYNIHQGHNIGNREFILNEMKWALHSTEANVVLLQEVSGHNHRDTHHIQNWFNRAQFEFLADQRWSHFAYGKNAVYTQGHHGNAILSENPIVEWRNLNISTNRFEHRGCLHAKIIDPLTQKMANLLCVHLNLLEGGRQIQIEKIIRYIESHQLQKEPLILAGDFNDWGQKLTALLEEKLQLKEAFWHSRGAHAKSFPSFSPFLPLDRIYYANLNLKEAHISKKIDWRKLSDHCGLYATFEF